MQTPIDLGAGATGAGAIGADLRLRWATAADTEALAIFNHQIHDEAPTGAAVGAPKFDQVGELVRDYHSDRHPLTRPEDFTLVENTATGEIVSSACLISHTWVFGGAPFPMGRPELVGTLPAYRRRGLVRKQFELIHARSAARGELFQGITGIPWYYRQFGYEMAMHLEGKRRIPLGNLPAHDPETSPYRLRPATPLDLPFMRQTYEHHWLSDSARQPFAWALSEAHWQFEFDGYRAMSSGRRCWHILENTAGEALGYLCTYPWVKEGRLYVTQVELRPDQAYLPVLPTLMHNLAAIARQTPAVNGELQEIKELTFGLGVAHPLYAAWPQGWSTMPRPYAWYLRIPDLPAWFNQVKPGLERHLAQSPAAGYTGELRFHSYRNGVYMKFDQGHILTIEAWRPENWYDGDARFPDLTFLQIIGGRRRCADLLAEWVDCQVNNKAEVLLNALFPPFTGEVWFTG